MEAFISWVGPVSGSFSLSPLRVNDGPSRMVAEVGSHDMDLPVKPLLSLSGLTVATLGGVSLYGGRMSAHQREPGFDECEWSEATSEGRYSVV